MRPPLLKGPIEVASAAILFGTIGIFVSLVNRMPIGSIIVYRLLLGITAIATFFACCGRIGERCLKENKPYIFLT